MHTRVLLTSDPQAFPAALEVLRRGELVAFPTDTVYGLAADLFNPAAIQRIFDAKGRDSAKAIPVLLGNLDHLPQVALDLPAAALRLAQRFWPGALTLVVYRQPGLPEILSPDPTVGVRMPDHPFALALLERSGPLAVTSANQSGATNPLTAQDVLAQLDGRIALILDGGAVPGGVPSTVVDCTSTPPAILRLGAVSKKQVTDLLEAYE
jgi:L-threonylcarbamoyladenylate synthase